MTCDCARPNDDYPQLSALTDRFRKGAPRSFAISAAGHRLAFLRSAGPQASVLDLWVVEQLDREPIERRLVAAADLLQDDEQLSEAELTARLARVQVTSDWAAVSHA